MILKRKTDRIGEQLDEALGFYRLFRYQNEEKRRIDEKWIEKAEESISCGCAESDVAEKLSQEDMKDINSCLMGIFCEYFLLARIAGKQAGCLEADIGMFIHYLSHCLHNVPCEWEHVMEKNTRHEIRWFIEWIKKLYAFLSLSPHKALEKEDIPMEQCIDEMKHLCEKIFKAVKYQYDEKENQTFLQKDFSHSVNRIITRMILTIRMLSAEPSILIPVKAAGDRTLLYWLCDCCHNFQAALEETDNGFVCDLFLSSLKEFVDMWCWKFRKDELIPNHVKNCVETTFIREVQEFLESLDEEE